MIGCIRVNRYVMQTNINSVWYLNDHWISNRNLAVRQHFLNLWNLLRQPNNLEGSVSDALHSFNTNVLLCSAKGLQRHAMQYTFISTVMKHYRAAMQCNRPRYPMLNEVMFNKSNTIMLYVTNFFFALGSTFVRRSSISDSSPCRFFSMSNIACFSLGTAIWKRNE